jgi:hypothetical protein
MPDNKILVLNFLFVAFSTNAYSHTGVHNDGWIQTLIHFATSPDHVLFIIVPAIIILGFVIFYGKKYFT